MEWYVYCENIQQCCIETYNIFKHAAFDVEVSKLLTQCKTKEEFIEKLKQALSYYFKAICEYEVTIMPLIGGKPEECKKVDVYTQVKLNWDRFIDYVWSFRK